MALAVIYCDKDGFCSTLADVMPSLQQPDLSGTPAPPPSPVLAKKKPPEADETARPNGDEPPRQERQFTPTKKQDVFDLPLGAKVKIPPGTLLKKDAVVCYVVSPNDREIYKPPLGDHESLGSEIFSLVACKTRVLKHDLQLCVPYFAIDRQYFSLSVLSKPARMENWETRKFTEQAAQVEFESDYFGTFLVTQQLKSESFLAPVNGILFNSRLFRSLSFRIARKALISDIDVTVRVYPMTAARLQEVKSLFPQCNDIYVISDMYEFDAVSISAAFEFRKAATYKFPWPPANSDPTVLSQSTLTAVCRPHGSNVWQVAAAQSDLKLINNTAVFDCKHFGSFMLVASASPRAHRVHDVVTCFADHVFKAQGELLVFTKWEEKTWKTWVEFATTETAAACRQDILKKGFHELKLETSAENGISAEVDKIDISQRFSTKLVPKKFPVKPQLSFSGVELHDNQRILIKVKGDICVKPEAASALKKKVSKGSFDEAEITEITPGKDCYLCFHKKLAQNFRHFEICPRQKERRNLTGSFDLHLVGKNGLPEKDPIRSLPVVIPLASVVDYLSEDVEEEEEFLPVPTDEVALASETTEIKKSLPSAKRPGLTAEEREKSFRRLTAPSKHRPQKSAKEPRVLSGRSLQVLSRVVREGLVLAVHLGIPDSTITGIGFDALSNGCSLTDVSYKILLHWKRTIKHLDPVDQATILIDALRYMGREDLADVVAARNKTNEELLLSSFKTY